MSKTHVPRRIGAVPQRAMIRGETTRRSPVRPVLLLTLLFGSLWGGLAPAQTIDGDPQAGRDLARQVCSACHLVELDEIAFLGPRSFAELAADPETTEPAIRLFLRTPHVVMPNFILSEDQIGDIAAYIISLRPRSPAE